MANHASARKRARQALRRRARNRGQRTQVRGAIKRVRDALEAGDGEAAGQALRQAESVLRRAASKGVLHWKTASRQISRLARATHS